MKRTYKGPQGITLELDPSHIFPDDPGSGTPALVSIKKRGKEFVGTYWCVAETGYIEDSIILRPEQLEWIESMEVEIDRMYTTHRRIN